MVLAILLLSGAIAFARGMVKELLRLGAWVGAGFAAIYGFAYVRPYARSVIPVDFLADTLAGVGIFLVTLVLLSFLAHFIAEHVRGNSLGALDRSLGFVFGLVRGAAIVCLGYLFVAWIVRGENLPDWVIEARTRPLIEQGATLLVQLAPPGLRNEAMAAAETARQRARQAVEAERKVRELSEPPTRADDGTLRPGYSTDERKEMDRLFQSTQ